MARNPSLEEERERGEPLDGAPLCTGYRRSLSFKRRCRHGRSLCTTAATDSLRAAGSKISSFFFLSRKEAAAGPCAALPAGGAHLHQEQEARAALVYSQLLGRRGGEPVGEETTSRCSGLRAAISCAKEGRRPGSLKTKERTVKPLQEMDDTLQESIPNRATNESMNG